MPDCLRSVKSILLLQNLPGFFCADCINRKSNLSFLAAGAEPEAEQYEAGRSPYVLRAEQAGLAAVPVLESGLLPSLLS